jgi:hypothetical protein
MHIHRDFEVDLYKAMKVLVSAKTRLNSVHAIIFEREWVWVCPLPLPLSSHEFQGFIYHRIKHNFND